MFYDQFSKVLNSLYYYFFLYLSLQLPPLYCYKFFLSRNRSKQVLCDLSKKRLAQKMQTAHFKQAFWDVKI